MLLVNCAFVVQSKSKMRKEEERLRCLEAKLIDEQKKQKAHVDRVNDWFKVDKTQLFTPNSWSSSDILISFVDRLVVACVRCACFRSCPVSVHPPDVSHSASDGQRAGCGLLCHVSAQTSKHEGDIFQHGGRHGQGENNFLIVGGRGWLVRRALEHTLFK